MQNVLAKALPKQSRFAANKEMKQSARLTILLAMALFAVYIVRTFAFTLYLVPVSYLSPGIIKGDVVAVNKTASARLHRGDVVIFHRDKQIIGRIWALPGDTITWQRQHFVVPLKGKGPCRRCTAKGYYLIRTGTKTHLVCGCDIVGSAHKLFYWGL